MEKVIEFLDANEAKWIDRLSENVAVASISCQPENRPQTIEQMHIADKMLKGLGCSTEMVDIGKLLVLTRLRDFEDSLLISLLIYFRIMNRIYRHI